MGERQEGGKETKKQKTKNKNKKTPALHNSMPLLKSDGSTGKNIHDAIQIFRCQTDVPQNRGSKGRKEKERDRYSGKMIKYIRQIRYQKSKSPKLGLEPESACGKGKDLSEQDADLNHL